MKNSFLHAGWAAAFFLIGSCGLIRAADPLVAFSSQVQGDTKRTLLPVGTSRASFLENLGPPDVWLSRDACAYWDRSTNQPELTRDYDTLLVQFERGRVGRLRIVAGTAIREFLAQREKRAAGAPLALATPASAGWRSR